MKICTRCKQPKEPTLDNFRARQAAPDGLRSVCKECLKQSDKKYKADNIYKIRAMRMKSYYKNREAEIKRAKILAAKNPQWGKIAADNYKRKRPYYDSIRQRGRLARLDNMPFDEPSKIEEHLMSLPQVCNYCGVDKDTYLKSDKNFRGDLTFQIDKIVPRLGYVVGNITLACAICNSIKGNWFDEETMKEIGKQYVSKHWSYQADRVAKH